FNINKYINKLILSYNNFSITLIYVLTYFLGGLKLFIQKDKKYEKYEKSSRIVMVTSMFLLFITLILKIIFEWSFLDYIANILKCGFILSLFIDAVPDFLEKNIKRIIWDLIFILIMILIFFDILFR
ncbi:hypothetical protein, partial [Staphylococcus equorum]|uniref:hypothetical protein n=3 Tax=Staphylococcus equorum TaxID=246432 RepID=UPI001F546BB5